MKNLVKRAIHGVGYDLRRYTLATSSSAQLMAILNHHAVNLVFDIGANTGGFGKYLRGIGYASQIVSFEPMQTAHDALTAAIRKDKRWHAATRCAIGELDGQTSIHIAANSESSSILDMLDAHAKAAPESVYVGVENVPLRKLDTLSLDYLDSGSILFLKIDTQGYEEQVLLGAPNTLSRAVVLQMELSLVPLYAGQLLMPEMVAKLKAMGFDLWGISPVFVDPGTGRALQVDGIFARTT